MLRDYQKDIYDKIRYNLVNHNGVIAVLPCRSGKSYIMEAICDAARKKNSQVLILAHRNILLEQHRELIDYPNVRIESVFTEANHLGENGPVDLIIIDEAHISGCKTYHDVCDYYKCKRVLFTATPSRLDGKPLDLGDIIVEGITAEELIEMGYISDYDLYAPKVDIDLSKLTVNDGDYSTVQLEEVMLNPKIYGDILKYYKELADNKQAIAYCTSIKHSMAIKNLFDENGYPARHIDSHTPLKEREMIMQDFKEGKFKILCTVNIISEGITLPTCEVCLALRPTQSLSLWIQQACRALTPVKGKKAVIIDYTGNVFRHGMPTEQHEWSLEERKKCRNSSGEEEVIARRCSECLRVYEGNDKVCPYCGHDNGKTKKQIEEEKRIELEKITEIQKKEKRREVGRTRSFEELCNICRERGYKPGWTISQAKLKGIPIIYELYWDLKKEME